MRPVTLFIGQWVDLKWTDFLDLASSVGYDGVELMFRSNVIDLEQAAASKDYCAACRSELERRSLGCWSISAAYIGKCVGDEFDVRHDQLVPPRYRGKPEEIRKWAVDSMLAAPTAARNMGCQIVHSFLGSPIWHMLYSYPRREESLVEEGFARIAERWLPILDEFARQGVQLAFETHPSEIAYDTYTLERLFTALKHHPAFRLNFDPSHITWQGIDPQRFLKRFLPSVIHVHMKDVKVELDGDASILGSHLPFGDLQRGWNFRSPGHGQVPFESLIRILNAGGYSGPLSVEWEDNGMDRDFGVRDAYRYVRSLNFTSAQAEFDAIPRFGE